MRGGKDLELRRPDENKCDRRGNKKHEKAESANEAIYETGSLLGRAVLLRVAPPATSTY